MNFFTLENLKKAIMAKKALKESIAEITEEKKTILKAEKDEDSVSEKFVTETTINDVTAKEEPSLIIEDESYYDDGSTPEDFTGEVPRLLLEEESYDDGSTPEDFTGEVPVLLLEDESYYDDGSTPEDFTGEVPVLLLEDESYYDDGSTPEEGDKKEKNKDTDGAEEGLEPVKEGIDNDPDNGIEM